jgi:hypothetical protein
VTEQNRMELDRHFAWFEGKLPPRAARFVAWLRKPSSRLARIPLALLLIVGGIFSFLPVLGLWMLPLGLLLVALDVPVLQKPMSRMLGWIERKWEARIARGSPKP